MKRRGDGMQAALSRAFLVNREREIERNGAGEQVLKGTFLVFEDIGTGGS